MSFIKFGSAVLTRPIMPVENWVSNKVASTTAKPNSYLDATDFPIDRFLFSQATIMGSVDLENNGMYLKQGYEPLVNMNGDCWTNKVTMATHHTYRGAYNFLNHIQIPEQSKGTVLDSVPRIVKLSNGLPSVYIDILVATDRKHSSLCQDIESGQLNAMSLGSIVKFSMCSKCGKICRTGSDYCSHLLNERRGMFTDQNGKRRIIAEVCGKEDIPDSNIFIEASWVYEPAFYGAVKKSLVKPSTFVEPNTNASIYKVKKSSYIEPTESMDLYMASVKSARRKRDV